MKILIGIDDSPHSEAALGWVKGMTWAKGVRVVVASAVHPVIPVYAEIYVPPTGYERVFEEEMKARREMVAKAERTLRNAGLDAEGKVLTGDPRDALVDAVRAEGVQLLVIGSHGRTGLSKLLMGSVASHVVVHAPCSVMVVKLPPTT